MALDTLPQGMVQMTAQVLAHRRIAADHFLMRVKAPAIARAAQPGQFIHILCQDPALLRRGAAISPLLRRPFSLSDTNSRAGTVEFIYKVVGLGTEALAQVSAGARVDLLGPLGRPFEVPAGLKRAVLVGGGVGIPPLYFLAKRLKTGQGTRDKGHVKSRSTRSVEVEVLLGARTKDWVICKSDFEKLGLSVRIATDDGTLGYRGSVVELLKNAFARPASRVPRPCVYICGPTPMMAAAAQAAQKSRCTAQVSLEERMGCAMGVCWGCVVEVTTEPKTAHARFQRVCTEGPVFPAESILWSTS